MVSGVLQLSYYNISVIDFPPIDFSLFLFPHQPYVISVESESGILNAASTPAPQGYQSCDSNSTTELWHKTGHLIFWQLWLPLRSALKSCLDTGLHFQKIAIINQNIFIFVFENHPVRPSFLVTSVHFAMHLTVVKIAWTHWGWRASWQYLAYD